jgi:hypothetical protein
MPAFTSSVSSRGMTGEADRPILNELSRAVVAYIGRGEEKFPRARAEKLVELFGKDAPELESDVRALIRDMDGSVGTSSADPGEAFRAVKADYAARHPELTDDAVAALAWKWSWDNR